MEYTLFLEVSVQMQKCFFNLLLLFATSNNVPLTVFISISPLNECTYYSHSLIGIFTGFS